MKNLHAYFVRLSVVFFISFFTLFNSSVFGQHLVSGKVADNNGEPLIGVTIQVINTDQGLITDANGGFSIVLLNEGWHLFEFSYVGFETLKKEIQIPNGKTLDVQLVPKIFELKETVVTALAIEKETKALGYSVTEIDGNGLTEARETNLGNALAGLVAGVNVSNIASGSSGSSRIVIRGNTSISRDNQPLFVVDGIPIDNSSMGSASLWGGQDWGDGLTSIINPDDIGSISVLKGNTAAALYGARAANGVVMISSKRGTKRKGIGVEYSSNLVFERPTVEWDFQKQYGQGFANLRPTQDWEAFGSTTFAWGGALDGSDRLQIDGVNRPYEYVGDNFKRFYRTGNTWTNTLNFTGGTEQFNFRFSLSNLDNKGILPKMTYNRRSGSFTSNAIFGRKLSAQFSARYINESTNNRPKLSDSPGNPMYGLGTLAPNVNVEIFEATDGEGAMDDGNEMVTGWNPWLTNPVWAAHKFETHDRKDRLFSSVLLKYQLNDQFYIQGRIGTDIYNMRQTDITPWGTGYQPRGGMSEQEMISRNTNMDFLIGYQNKISKDIDLDINFGGNQYRSFFENTGLGGSDFNIPYLYTINNQAFQWNWYGLWRTQTNSLYGTAGLAVKNMLYFNFTGRNDWFSTLPIDNNNLFFPSAGVSFIFSEILKMPKWISFGKLRASWAEVSGATSPYSLDISYNLLGQGHLGQPLGNISNYVVPDRALAPSLNREFEIGLDLRFFGDRLGVDLALYNNKTTNDIIQSTISDASGFEWAFVKEGELENRGIEFLLRVKPIKKKKVEWETSFNFAYNRNEVLYLGEDVESIQIDASRTFTTFIHHQVGEPASVIKGFPFRRNANGEIIHDENGLPMVGDLSVLGQGVHPLTGGWNNSIQYGKFYLNFLFDFKWGGELYSATNAYAYTYGLHQKTLTGRESSFSSQGVTEAGEQNFVTISPENLIDYYSHLASNISEEFVYDASFIKLRQLSLGVTIPKSLLEGLPFAEVNFSLVGRNLWLIYSEVPNVDPESTYNNSNAQGLELFGVPQTRSMGVNLNFKF